jgi:hypothetical protein
MVESVVVEGLLPPRPKNSPAYQIFHYDFHCRIAQMHLYSAEYLQQAGMLTTGNPAHDRAVATEMVDVRLNIAAMAEYIAEGATLAVVQSEDCAKIYRLIKAHLDNWKERVETSLHQIDVPVDDLRKLEAVAAAVYPYARYHLKEKPFHGRLVDALFNLRRGRGGMSRHTPEEQKAQHKEVVESLPQAHTPMADNIASHALQRRKGWDSKTPR